MGKFVAFVRFGSLLQVTNSNHIASAQRYLKFRLAGCFGVKYESAFDPSRRTRLWLVPDKITSSAKGTKRCSSSSLRTAAMATATSTLFSLSSLSASLPSPAQPAPASLSLRAVSPRARLSASYAAFPIGTISLSLSPRECSSFALIRR